MSDRFTVRETGRGIWVELRTDSDEHHFFLLGTYAETADDIDAAKKRLIDLLNTPPTDK